MWPLVHTYVDWHSISRRDAVHVNAAESLPEFRD